MKWDNGVYNMAPIAPEEISDRMNDRRILRRYQCWIEGKLCSLGAAEAAWWPT